MAIDRSKTPVDRDLRARVARTFVGLAIAASLPLAAAAQSGQVVKTALRFDDPKDIQFQAIADAMRGQFTIKQERRILEDENPDRWVTVRESLLIGPDHRDGSPRFKLEFIDLVGAHLSAGEKAARSQQYATHGSYLHLHAAFHIADAEAADANYVLHYLGKTKRLDRQVQQVAVLPKDLTRSAWLLELDVITGYPLYQAEYRFDGKVVSTIECTEFATGLPQSISTIAWWQPTQRTVTHATVGEAIATLPKATFVFPDASMLPPGFDVQGVRVVYDDLNRQTTLVVTFGDGIDEIFVNETLNAPAPSLPANPTQSAKSDAYAIFAYGDMSVSQFMFHVKGTQVLVLGRSTQLWVRPMTVELLRRFVH